MTREEYKIYAEHTIKDISNRINELRQRANDVDVDIKAEFDEKMQNLIVMRDDLENQMNHFESTEENKWNEVKLEFTKGLDFLKQGFEKLFNILSN